MVMSTSTSMTEHLQQNYNMFTGKVDSIHGLQL